MSNRRVRPAGPPRSVVVVGSGRAGQRHAAAICRQLSPTRLLLVRRPDSTTEPWPTLEVSTSTFPDLAAALHEAAAAPSAPLVVVANPAPMHATAIRAALDAGATVLSEKPLASELSDACDVADHPRAAEAVVLGYHLRFGRLLPAAVEFVRSGALGDIIGSSFRVGQHLDQWRAGIDASQSVSARDELGGGALLELSHEIDAALAVLAPALGSVATVAATLATDGAPTDGIVDTVADLSLTWSDGVTTSIHLDMVSPQLTRVWTIDGTRGRLVVDLAAGTLHTSSVRTTAISTTTRAVERALPAEAQLTVDASERDVAEANLIDHVAHIADDPAIVPRCGVGDGVATLAIIHAARASAAGGGGPAKVPSGIARHMIGSVR